MLITIFFLETFLPQLVAKKAELERSHLNETKNRLTNLFNELLPLQEKADIYHHTYATGFNVFNLLRYGHYETRLHTPFLYSLLNPTGNHRLGFRFTEIMLSDLLEKQITGTEIKDYRLIEEHAIGEDGRIDLFITFRYENEKYCIAIENKINAGDQPNQLERYYNYMNNHFEGSIKKLIYLTKGGKFPSSYSLKNELLNKYLQENVLFLRSYKSHIKNWIDQILQDQISEIVRYTLLQYQQTINSFHYD